MTRKANPAQEQLLVMSGSEFAQARDFSSPEPDQGVAVNRIEQKLHLINCLAALSGASQRAGLVKIGPEGVTDIYGNAASAVVLGAARKGVELKRQAELEFARATGHFELVDSGLVPKRKASALTGRLLEEFKSRYDGHPNYRANFDYRRQLAAEVRGLTADPETDVSEFNRRHNLRPHKPQKAKTPTTATAEERVKLDQLDTREKMAAILSDPRAEFMPKTHREKNLVMTWLDYLDNPQFPLGVVNQLREVQIHSQRPDHEKALRYGARFGLRATESICWEVGDYLQDAATHLSAVRALRSEVIDCSPKVKVNEELGPGAESPSLSAWVRHRDLKQFVEQGNVTGLADKDPLATSERRLKPKTFGDVAPGKHKTILNQYTRPDPKESFAGHISATVDGATIGELRAELPEVEQDLARERRFMERRLVEIRQHGNDRLVRTVNQIFDKLKGFEVVA